ncbi:hypothetical protein HID58_003723, partial [Brassica napus]
VFVATRSNQSFRFVYAPVSFRFTDLTKLNELGEAIMDITTAYNEETQSIHRDTTFCVSVFDSLAMQLNAKKFGNDVAFFLTLPSEPIFYFDSERTAGDSYVKGMLDGEANQTAVRKLIQKCYMEDSSSRSLGLLSHVRPYSFKGCWSYKAASLMLWIYTRKHKLNVFRRKVIDPLTTVKACVKNDGVANALIQYQWRPKSYITVCDLAVDAHQEEIERAISKVTVDIHGSFVSMSSSVHP